MYSYSILLLRKVRSKISSPPRGAPIITAKQLNTLEAIDVLTKHIMSSKPATQNGPPQLIDLDISFRFINLLKRHQIGQNV